MIKLLGVENKKKRCVFEIFRAETTTTTVFLITAPTRGAGLSTVFLVDRFKFFFLEAINFLQAIKITSDKAFRLFSERRKSSILLDSPLWKEKEKE